MKNIIAVFICLFISISIYAQNKNGLTIYSKQNNKSFTYFQKNSPGYLGIESQCRIKFADTLLLSFLIQLDHQGNFLTRKPLRNFYYPNYFIKDTTLILSGIQFKGYPDTLGLWVLEFCDLDGNVKKSVSQAFKVSAPLTSISYSLNDSTEMFVQQCINLLSNRDTMVSYIINLKDYSFSKGIDTAWLPVNGPFLKINNTPEYLGWGGFGSFKTDAAQKVFKQIKQDTLEFSQTGTFYPRLDKPGYVGFGGCHTYSDFYEMCMIAMDENLKIDKVDVLYHPNIPPFADNPATTNPFCQSGDSFYGVGILNYRGFNEVKDTEPIELVMVKYDKDLNRVWTKFVGGERRYFPNGVLPRDEGGFMMYGWVGDNFDNYKKVPFTLFIDADGNITDTKIPNANNYDFTIYGNPSKNHLRINASYPEHNINIHVADMQGRQVFRGKMQQGMNTYDASNWVNGTYVVNATDKSGKLLWATKWVKME